jgi:hypothetical protein
LYITTNKHHEKSFVVSFIIVTFLLFISYCKDDNSDDGKETILNVLDKITDPEFKKCIQTFITKGKIEAALPDFLPVQEAAAVER